MSDKVSRFLKAAAAIAACAGIAISPEQQEAILGGFLAIYSVVSAVQAKLGKE